MGTIRTGGVQWSRTGNLVIWDDAATDGIAWDCCCGCCGYEIADPVTVTFSGLGGSYAALNGAHSLVWQGYHAHSSSYCVWTVSPTNFDIWLSRVTQAGPTCDDGTALWWLEAVAKIPNPDCSWIWDQTSTDGNDYTGSYTYRAAFSSGCGTTGVTAVVS